MNDSESLIEAARRDRLYVEISETPEYSSGPWGEWLMCGDCGWDGPMHEEWDNAERDRWRHPLALCWLVRRVRAVRHWYGSLPHRRPLPPCNQHGHTWAWVGTYGPRLGERCYCRRAKWKTSRA